jgi:hypothetical protein
MNEKIKELLVKCQAESIDGPEYPRYVDQEKFAEMIVRECMAMCKTAVGNADYNTGRLHCLNNIKEHFGVE